MYSKESQLQNNRSKRKRKDKGRIPPDVYEAVLKRDKRRCAVCGSSTWLEQHHVVPRSQGGSGDDPSNLILLCKECHYVKLHGRGDYQTKRKVFLYMIRMGFDFKKELELLDDIHNFRNGEL